MKHNWQRSYEATRVYEGGNVDDPRDNGGRTSRGVTQRVYDAYRARHNKPQADVWKASEAEIAAIYRQQYWKVAMCDELPDGVDFFVWDTAVHSGVKRAYIFLQRALVQQGMNLKVDGTPGLVTIEASRRVPAAVTIKLMAAARLAFMRNLDDWPTYKRGWTSRVKDAERIALKFSQSSNNEPILGPLIPEEAEIAKASEVRISQPAVPPVVGTGVAVSAVTGQGAVEVLQQQLKTTQEQLSTYGMTLQVIQYALLVLIFVGLGMTLYSLWKGFKAKRTEEGHV